MKYILPQSNHGEQKSLRGYLSAIEFKKTIAKALKQSTLAGFGLYAVLVILGDFEKWYVGPYAAQIATIVALVMGYLRAQSIGAKYIEEGSDPK